MTSHLVRSPWLCASVLIVVFVGACHRVEQEAGKKVSVFEVGFLGPFWTDVIAIGGVVGLVLAVWGIWLAWKQISIANEQIKKTTAANEAATVAALETLAESREQYNRYVIAQASRLISETVAYTHTDAWALGAIRLRDLADLIIQVEGDDPEWADLARRIHTMESSFGRIAKNELKFSSSLKSKWSRLQQEVRTKIAKNYGPFVVSDAET